jgi:tetratricopeptide (TPR) repeat protein
VFEGQVKVLGEDHKDTLMTVNNLGIVYHKLKDYEKALEYYERPLKGKEKMLGKTHPSTLSTVMNIANVYNSGLKDYGKAEENYDRALQGFIEQLGIVHQYTKVTAQNYKRTLEASGNTKRLEELKKEYPWL